MTGVQTNTAYNTTSLFLPALVPVVRTQPSCVTCEAAERKKKQKAESAAGSPESSVCRIITPYESIYVCVL